MIPQMIMWSPLHLVQSRTSTIKILIRLEVWACTHKTRGFSVKARASEEKAIKSGYVENIGQYKQHVKSVEERIFWTREDHLFHTFHPFCFPCALSLVWKITRLLQICWCERRKKQGL